MIAKKGGGVGASSKFAVKSHNGLPVGILEEILDPKISQNLQERARFGVLFIVKLQQVIAY